MVGEKTQHPRIGSGGSVSGIQIYETRLQAPLPIFPPPPNPCTPGRACSKARAEAIGDTILNEERGRGQTIAAKKDLLGGDVLLGPWNP